MKERLKKITSDFRVRIGYAIAFGLLLLSYILTLYANHDFLNETILVNHTHRVMINTERLLSSLKDAESAFRGYIVLKDSTFLRPYYDGRDRTDSFFRALQQETIETPRQQQRLATIDQLIHKKYQIYDAWVQYYSTHDFEINDSLKIQAYFSHTLLLRINSIAREVEDSEETQLKARKDSMNDQYGVMNKIVMISLLLAFVLVIYGFITYAKENQARRNADKQINMYQKQLEQRITELDNANKELIRMRSIEKFAVTGRIARTIAHEVRNPLTNINLAADQLKTDLNGNSQESGSMLDMIQRNSNRINQLITDLLDSTKAADLKKERLSVNQLLEDTLKLAEDRLQLAKIAVEKHYSPQAPAVMVDKERIKIAFLNIIVNAIESMVPGKGILTIQTKEQHGRCVIAISDNGSGIDSESLSRLFEPYFTKKSGGTGLGLTNTQNIILTHNGQISAESVPGKGTTFFVSLNYQ